MLIHDLVNSTEISQRFNLVVFSKTFLDGDFRTVYLYLVLMNFPFRLLLLLLLYVYLDDHDHSENALLPIHKNAAIANFFSVENCFYLVSLKQKDHKNVRFNFKYCNFLEKFASTNTVDSTQYAVVFLNFGFLAI